MEAVQHYILLIEPYGIETDNRDDVDFLLSDF